MMRAGVKTSEPVGPRMSSTHQHTRLLELFLPFNITSGLHKIAHVAYLLGASLLLTVSMYWTQR